MLAKLTAGYDRAEIEQIQQQLTELNLAGTRRLTAGTDLGLREGNWDFVIVADFDDAAAYRTYDEDADHNRLRARLAPWIEQIARAQFEIPDN